MSIPVAKAPGQVLSTLDAQGRRIRLQPRRSSGRFWRHRGLVAYGLIALFVSLPFLEIGGRPALLMDLSRRELDLFGSVFRPSDGAVLMLLGLSVVLTVFLVTALWGRVWCGWGCPQTVYMEWVFRPIERLIKARVPRLAVFAVLSVAIANVFLAYFVPVERLAHWMTRSPVEHPAGFGVVALVSIGMFLDFAWFREQMCILACPYGRLQSVLLDKQSLIVGYDARRGEPRGKVSLKLAGDCVDCKACVTTCPTGIDIRQGLQMECIGCAQCVDACDAIMGRLGRPKGLIRYSSQDELEGRPRHVLRVRTVVYPALLAIAIAGLAWASHGRPRAEVWVVRLGGTPFAVLADGRVSSEVELRIENRGEASAAYAVTLLDAPDVVLESPQAPTTIAGGASTAVMVVAVSPRGAFAGGERMITIRISDAAGTISDVRATLLGPSGGQP